MSMNFDSRVVKAGEYEAIQRAAAGIQPEPVVKEVEKDVVRYVDGLKIDLNDHEVQLVKDGTFIEDPRLDRLAFFDERSRDFPIRTALQAELREEGKKYEPRSYTWRCMERFDQGPDGACVGFGIGHELAARPSEVQGLNDKFCKEQIYWEAQKIDPWNGGAYPQAFPFYEGTSVLAGIKIAKKLNYFSEYRWCFGIQDVLMALSYWGPVVVGTDWHTGMFSPDSKGFIRPTGRIAGGHCYMLDQYNKREGYIGGLNSWGKNWGLNGRFKMTVADFDRLLRAQGEAVVTVNRIPLPRRIAINEK